MSCFFLLRDAARNTGSPENSSLLTRVVNIDGAGSAVTLGSIERAGPLIMFCAEKGPLQVIQIATLEICLCSKKNSFN